MTVSTVDMQALAMIGNTTDLSIIGTATNDFLERHKYAHLEAPATLMNIAGTITKTVALQLIHRSAAFTISTGMATTSSLA